MATLTLKQGDTISRTVTIKDSAGVAINITGGTVKMKIAKNLTDTNATAIYYNAALTLTTPASGIATLAVTHAVSVLWTPGEYKWEIEYIDASSNYSHTDTGVCIIEKSIYSNG